MSRIETYQKKRKKKPSKRFVFTGLFLSVLMIISSIILIFLYFNGNEKVSFTTKENPIIYNGQLYEEQALVENEEVYLPFSFIKERIDEGVVYDEESKSIIITTRDKVVQFPNEDLQYFINEEPFSLQVPVLVNKNETLYVAAKPLFSIYPFQAQHVAETGAVIINKDGDVLLPGRVIETESSIKLKEKPAFLSGYVAEISSGEQVTVEKDEKDYYYIRKQNGIAGYVKKGNIRLEEPLTVELEKNSSLEKIKVPKLTWPINLTWEAVYSKNPNTANIPSMPGLNVISPTWFSLKNGEGDVSSLASLEYVKWAKAKQYQVWGLFSNDFDPEKTNVALKDFKTRQKIIRQLLEYANMYQLDGINIDFENINVEDSSLVTQFVKELSVYLHQAGLVVSMDITFISESENWSKFYERDNLANIVDYLIVMAYDEHWGTSPVAGSVASLPWVESNLQKLLEVVPNERLILGVPTYTRIWKEQQTPGGNIEVSSKAYSIDAVNQWINERDLTVQYDKNSGQDYVEYTNEKEKATYKIWLENEKSLRKRSQLVHKYQLAGIASWNRSFANEMAWQVIDDSLRQVEPVKKQ